MPKFCSNCGSEVKEGFKFCLSCGTEINVKSVKPQSTQPQQTPPSVVPQQNYVPMPPKKMNTKLIFGIIAIIAIVTIILVVVLAFTGGSSSQFEGTWNVESIIGDTDDQWTFYSNGTMKKTNDLFGGTNWSTWRIENNKVYLREEIDILGNGYYYEFSNGGNTIALKYSTGLSITVYTLTRV